MALAVLAATSTTSIVFFPVTFFYGVSKYLFTDLALGVVISIFASYFFAMTVVPLYCAQFIRIEPHTHAEGGAEGGVDDHASQTQKGWLKKVVHRFNEMFQRLLNYYEQQVSRALLQPGRTALLIMGGIVLLIAVLFPFVGRAYFPRNRSRTICDQRQSPAGTRLEVTDKYIAQVENDIRSVIPKSELNMIVSNIGITPDISAIYTSNSAMHTAFVQVNLKEDREVGRYRVYGKGATEACQRPAATERLLPGGRVGGFGHQSGIAGAAGHSGERQRPEGRIRNCSKARAATDRIKASRATC